ncbi:tRNA (adenosine(37)-N6)-dimethylallyltransferase MiaA [Nocardioides jejuensis]|uniref:tRNA dimethylallyltransferase n=1 Tax=Nocardioides jejuensis TaxID=2502782 RepID=A0A4R1CK82_9ACTN|nr:tRNA (adenosine(37)-N6)-dimethylallyltransferase MiaA [Nocardioides jejuensis]TCJ30408.1 tRNA (adenosine(37)-N6)-dimethylallyltransferase MiaA [Nocardioides jejuensis]
MLESATPVIAVVGPTAAGKTALSLDLAERLGGEIVNTDAMQVYRGMDIGTAKLPEAERRGVPHHLIDLMEISEVASVADFQLLARAAIAEIQARGKVPILVGGSALYTRAVLDRFEFPGTDAAVRARLEAELEAVGSGVLHERLASLDPDAAAGILASNGRRIVRALEVVELTGQPFSASLPVLEYAVPGALQVGVRIDRPTLHARIALRVDLMWEQGLVEEVRALMADGLATTRTASRAIGYPETMAFIDGRLSEAEAKERIVIATRRFARRQDQWFLKDPRVTWLDWDAPDLADQALRRL